MGRIKVRSESKYKRRRAVLVLILLVSSIALVTNIISKTGVQKLASSENALYVGGEEIDISNIISSEPNPPAVRGRYDTY